MNLHEFAWSLVIALVKYINFQGPQKTNKGIGISLEVLQNPDNDNESLLKQILNS